MLYIYRLNVKLLFPKFLKVFNKGTTKPAYQLMPPVVGTGTYDKLEIIFYVILSILHMQYKIIEEVS